MMPPHILLSSVPHVPPSMPPDHLFELAPGFYAVGDCYGGREYGEASGLRCSALVQDCGAEVTARLAVQRTRLLLPLHTLLHT